MERSFIYSPYSYPYPPKRKLREGEQNQHHLMVKKDYHHNLSLIEVNEKVFARYNGS